jgi:hypothetical protein
MGLLDVLNGMQNGPRGQRDPSSGGGMSPITMAVLGLLAYKALKSFGGGHPAQAGTGPSAGAAPSPGGLGGLPGGGLGGLLAGGAAGSILSGGLADLVRQFQQNGQGDVLRSSAQWIGASGIAAGGRKPLSGAARRRTGSPRG